MVGELLLGDLRLLLLGQLVEEELGAHGLFGGGAGVGVELLAGGALRLEHGVQDGLVAAELSEQLLQLAFDLLLDDALRQRHLGLLEGGGEDLVADLLGLLALLGGLDLLGQVLAQLVDGVELGGHLRELVVGVGQLADLDGLDGDGDLGVLALMLAGDELGAELLGLALGQADDGVVEAVDEVTGADLVGQALGGGLLQLLAVDGGRQVDGDEVAVLDGALDAGEGAEAGEEVVELGLHGLVVGLEGIDLDGDVGEVRQLDLGADVDLGGELDELAVLQLGDVDVGLADDLQIVLLDGLAVAGGDHLVEDLLEDGAAADAGLDELGRGLALAEARDLDLLREGLVGLVEFRLELVEGDLDGNLDAGGALLLDGGLHWLHTPVSRCELNDFTDHGSARDAGRGSGI